MPLTRVRRFSLALILALAAIFVYLATLNFHEVESGQMYRSGQLRKAELGVILRLFKIKTVVNLRGENKAEWFKDEVQETAENHVQLINIDMSSREIPDRDNLRKLIEAYHTAERPLLVHDLSGADRAGEAAALYQLVVQHKSKDEALEMLNWRYHHFDFLRPAKRYFIEQFKSEEWALNEYDPCSGQFKYYDTKNIKCHPETKKACGKNQGHPFSETPQCQ